jgi:protein TonB
VQYLEPPAVDYPRASRRADEAGRVLLRVYIDEAGLPRQVLVSQSSGFVRLDEAAVAAMKRARFKPYTENGRPTAGWAPAPIDFELER